VVPTMSFEPEIRKTIDMCRYCFMCRHASSTFRVTKLDGHTPRGYGLLLSLIDDGHAPWTVDVAEKLYQSTLDGVCREICAFHWPEDDVVQAGRVEAINRGVVPAVVERVIDQARSEGAVPLPSGLNGLGVDTDRVGAEVLYLTGSMSRLEAPELIVATATILNGMGANWTMLGQEPPSGGDLWELGLSSDAREAANRLMVAITRLRPRRIVTADSHLCRALRELYPSWGVGDIGQIVVLHIVEFVAAGIANGTLPLAHEPNMDAVAYHDPCHLGRRLRVLEAPRRVIAAVTGHPPVEFPHAGATAECCGGGALLYATYPELSASIADARLSAIWDSGVHTLVTACVKCRRVLAEAAIRAGSRIQVRDIVELVADRM
jgi:Fe-S oxidoreductase